MWIFKVKSSRELKISIRNFFRFGFVASRSILSRFFDLNGFTLGMVHTNLIWPYDMVSFNMDFWVQFWFYNNKLSTKLGRSFRFFSLSGSLFFVGSEFFSSELELCGTISSRRFFSLFILRVERRIPLQMVLLQCSIRLFVRPFRTAFQFSPSELIFGVLISIYLVIYLGISIGLC